MDVLGRIYVAHEGINAQLSVPAPKLMDFKFFLDSIDFLKGVGLNIAVEHDNESFLKLTVKVREKIVADGLHDEAFDVTQIGQHVDAENFNALMDCCSMARKVRPTQRSIANVKMESANGKMTRKRLSTRQPCPDIPANKPFLLLQ